MRKSPPKSIPNYSLRIIITYIYDKININNFILLFFYDILWLEEK